MAFISRTFLIISIIFLHTLNTLIRYFLRHHFAVWYNQSVLSTFFVISSQIITFITQFAKINCCFNIVNNLNFKIHLLTIRNLHHLKVLYLKGIFQALFLFLLFYIITFLALHTCEVNFIYYQAIFNLGYWLTN